MMSISAKEATPLAAAPRDPRYEPPGTVSLMLEEKPDLAEPFSAQDLTSSMGPPPIDLDQSVAAYLEEAPQGLDIACSSLGDELYDVVWTANTST